MNRAQRQALAMAQRKRRLSLLRQGAVDPKEAEIEFWRDSSDRFYAKWRVAVNDSQHANAVVQEMRRAIPLTAKCIEDAVRNGEHWDPLKGEKAQEV